jgi:acetyl-CoA C-acetyltransferase
MQHDPIVIVSAKRTPMGNFNGIFKDITSPSLGSHVIAGMFDELPLTKEKIDQVIMGCVLSAGLGQAPARQAALGAQLSSATPCVTVNKMCGSGMKSVVMALREIQSRQANIIVAGGMENMSRAPYLLSGARTGLRMGTQTLQDHLQLDGLVNAYPDYLSMGELAEACATKFDITREAQDQFAIESIERATQATQSGFFKDEITPITIHDKKETTIITADEGIQKANIKKIPLLKPAFTKDGTITAANASSISDGAAALLLMPLSIAQKNNIKPLATIVGDHTFAQAPEWFSTAPIAAIEQLLLKIHWSIKDVDLFEINEAFSVVTLAAMKTLSIPRDKMNVHGGACILGHPIGASGARILVTLIHALRQQGKKRGVAAICIGGGEAMAIAVESV